MNVIFMIIIGILIYFFIMAVEYRFVYIHLIIAFIMGLLAYNSFILYEIGKGSLYDIIFEFVVIVYSVYKFFKIKSTINRIKINVLNILSKKDNIDDDVIYLLQIGGVTSQELVTILKILMKKGEIPYIYDVDKYYNLTH
jgi:hypothetical protein